MRTLPLVADSIRRKRFTESSVLVADVAESIVVESIAVAADDEGPDASTAETTFG